MKSRREFLIGSLVLLSGLSSMSAVFAQDHKFSDNDRKAAQDYHDQHKGKPAPGFRPQDKLKPEDEGRIREGAVLDADLRKQSHPVPADLLHRLPPPPKGHRYVVVGGQVCDVDSGWHISDVIHINLTL